MATSYVNLAADPQFLDPNSFERLTETVYQHVRGGERVPVVLVKDDLYVGDRRVYLYQSEVQRGYGCINGLDLDRELQALPADSLLNANMLDFLLEHPELIPLHWSTKEAGTYYGCGESTAVHFWGTTFCREWLPREPMWVTSLDFGNAGVSNPRNRWARHIRSVDGNYCKTSSVACLGLA